METRKEAIEPWESEAGEKNTPPHPPGGKDQRTGMQRVGVGRLNLELDSLGPDSVSATVQLHNFLKLLHLSGS